ncbi:D-lactate dehydrogenase mitochondrial precursor [Sphaerosporella brunnea]|uniref:D-lactate dehydrogenase (cytochrome) n=1 Tax=Sphaerosporella brunnea TaxID=1250544 RepID=A0A5J5ELZ4_9PEZI|nr:D-lactate dehydrogenase mitochondrial precursor [Sphaerosporella brunnea]
MLASKSGLLQPALRSLSKPRFLLRRPNSTAASSSKTARTWSTAGALTLAALTGGVVYGFTMLSSSSSKVYTASGKPAVKPTYGSVKDMNKAVEEIRNVLGEDAVSTEKEDLLQHGYSAWSTSNVERLPIAVVYPKNTEEVSKAVKICHKYRVPMIPFSGGTSLEGNFAAPFGGLSIDFTLMDQIIKFNEEDMDVVVQPAVSWMGLNESIKDSGLFFPVDPGPTAKIGGMVGTNCSGTNAVRYGTMKDWVINLTVVLADGTVIKTKRRPRLKSSAGYNLNSLFIGSEGTLGLVTEITLKLAVIPQQTTVAVVTFPTIRDAAAAASGVMRAGVPVACMEVMDEVQMMVVNKAGSTGKEWKELPTLFFKFSGTKAGVLDNISTVKEIAKKHRAGNFEFAKDEKEAKLLWSARKESLWSMLALRKSGQEVWSTDVAVPLSRLADIIEISKKEMDSLGMFASILGHVGDGNFHESIMYDKRNPQEVEKIEKVVHDMVDRALEMEGTCTGEHGVGLGKKAFLVKELGHDTLGVMRSMKAALDPLWLLNPGKIIDANPAEK